MSSSNVTKVLDKKPSSTLLEELGFSIEDLFRMARHFLKENKEIQIKYDDNIRFIALLKQAQIGKWNASYTQNVGFLDVVGNNRKQAWMALGDMSKDKAMEEYVKLLFDRYPIFRDYLEAQRVTGEETDRIRLEDETRHTLEEEAERARQYEQKQVTRIEEQKKKREEFQRKQVQDALNQQTYSQFKAYAEQQYKDNRQAQEELIQQLQEQHFQQYMQQVYQKQLLNQQQQIQTKVNMEQQPSESILLPPVPTNVEQTNGIPPPTLTNAVPSSVPPTNIVAPPISFAPSISQMPPLGPAPAQLPPVVHPPPLVLPQSVINGNATIQEIKMEPVIPIEAQFETLNLTTPLEPIPPIPQLFADKDLTQQQFPPLQMNNELNTAQELVDGNPIAPPAADGTVALNATGDSSLIPEEGRRELPNIAPANMWTRKDLKEFKEQIRKEKDAVIKVGSGETVTVRVPTHEDGRCIFWEFASDYYDIGFGLYFEWSKAPSNTVTVHVSDSSEEDEEGEEGRNPEKKDIEKGVGSTNKPPKPPQDEIVPIYRRDCHEEVFAGSHPYPGHGVYLLKFDNSYSLWRSKTLYYRVYYSK